MLVTQVPSFYKQRRDRLMALTASQGAAYVLPSTPEFWRNPDVDHPFRQESNFYYLTGFEEAHSCLVLCPSAAGGKGYRMVMFVMKRDPEREMWDGERYGVDGAKSIFGADEAYLIDELPAKLPELLKGVDKVYYRQGMVEANDRLMFDALEKQRRAMGRSGRGLASMCDPNETIGEMRLFKSPEEAERLRKACTIAANAHKKVMEQTRPGMNEYEIEALVNYEFRRNGSPRFGYGSIVAGGKNAACLHYRANNEVLKDGDLLLIDAGTEFDYYTSDITRTFPIGRTFTSAQAKIYDLVLKSQMEALAICKPGTTMPAIHNRATEVLIDGMLSLGLLKGDPKEILKSGAFRRFYPHGTGHYLGMDVHDVGLYQKNGEPRALEAGMCFTVEPGFYVQPTDKEAPAEFRNIGVRIEDDVLITATGHENMTEAAPKTREDIEKLRKF